jgi:hypothetical protein
MAIIKPDVMPILKPVRGSPPTQKIRNAGVSGIGGSDVVGFSSVSYWRLLPLPTAVVA